MKIVRTMRAAPDRPSSRIWLASVALATALICMPFVRAIFSTGDEGVLLHGAERMLQGSRLYADFFEFLPPGGFVLTAIWLNIAGVSILSARILAILTVVGIACFTYLACRRASGNAPLSAILTIGWAVMSQGGWTQVSHHWLTTLFSMIGAWAALASLAAQPRQFRWPLIAGAAVGMAGMVTPTRGALATLAALTAFLNLRQNRTELIVYVLAVMLVPAGLVLYLVFNDSFVAAFDSVIRFTASRYAAIQYVPFGSFATAQSFPLIYLFPLAAVLLLVVCVRDWRAALRDRLLHLCTAFGLAGFVGCFPRPDVAHIAVAAPLAYPLLLLCLSRLIAPLRPSFRFAYGAVAVMLHIPSALALAWFAQLALSGEAIATPRGDVRSPVDSVNRAKLLARIEALPPSDSVFFYPYMPMLPFLSGREHVAKYDIFLPWYTLPSQYHDACLSVMREAKWLVFDHTWSGPGGWKQIYPAMPDVQPQETIEFELALGRGFDLVAQDGTFELRRRQADAGDDICAGLAK